MNSLRPNFEDRDALRILFQREDLSDFNAEFLESLRNWRGAWTEKQLKHFDRLCLDYFGAC